MFLPEKYKIVQLSPPVTTNGGVISDYVTLKNANMAYIVVEMTQAVGHATSLALYQSSAVAGTGAKVFANIQNIWANEDTAATDTLVAQTAAINYAVTNDVKNKMVIFQVDPAAMDVASGFDVLNLVVSDSSQATNLISL